jgi:hypothetical protein
MRVAGVESHRWASVKAREEDEVMEERVVVLFDSGASGSNYVSDRFVDGGGLRPQVKSSRTKCRIANGVVLEGMIRLHISFETNEGVNTEGWCEFEILKGLREELILGIPDIVAKFKELFVQMVQGVDLNFIQQLDGQVTQTMDPWVKQCEVAEEEELIPNTSIELCFLEVPYEEAFEEYLEMLPSRVSEDLKENTEVMELLEGEGAESFNPRDWKMDPVVFEFDVDMPKEIKRYRSKVPHGLEGPYDKE